MASERPTVTKRLFLWLVITAGATLALLLFVMRPAMSHQAAQVDSAAVRNLTVTIDKQNFTLKDGVAEQPAAPGSAATNTLRVVGDPVSGDVSGDGRPDAALLLANDPGGSGTFYFAVVAVNDGSSFHATNALPLGDRIKPRDVSFDNGVFSYRFLERQPGESMAADPRLPKTVTVRLDPVSGRIDAVS
jgi:hypothetical protein